MQRAVQIILQKEGLQNNDIRKSENDVTGNAHGMEKTNCIYDMHFLLKRHFRTA
jgi:hypothetical protein